MLYIISKSRAQTLKKTLPHAIATGLPITISVEPSEIDEYVDMYRSLGTNGKVEFLKLKMDGRGVSASRYACVKHAHKAGWPIMIFSDDDLKLPANTLDLATWLAANHKAPGVGVWFSIYQHFLGIQPDTGVHKHKGGMGNRAFAVRPHQLLKVGAFRNGMPTHDDDEMFLLLLKRYGVPWNIHSGVKAGSILPRHAPGGIMTTPGTPETRERVCYEKYCERFGQQYFTLTTRGIRVKWKLVYSDWTDLDYPSLQRRTTV